MKNFGFPILIFAICLLTCNGSLGHTNEEIESVTHGNISGQGPTGMFQNPTARMLEKNEMILQYCVFITESNNNQNILTHKAIASYGVTEWFELGLRAQVFDQDNATVGDNTKTAGGIFTRLRLLKDEGLVPDFSIGGITAEGDGDPEVTRHTLFAAASKGLGLKDRGWPIDFTLHIGYRNGWDNGGAEEDIAYIGGEIALPKHIYLVSEVSTRRDPARQQHHTPYSVGIQVRHPNGPSFTFAAAQNGRQNELGWLVGIGINFEL